MENLSKIDTKLGYGNIIKFYNGFNGKHVDSIIKYFNDSKIDKKVLMIGGTSNMAQLMSIMGFKFPIPYQENIPKNDVSTIILKYSSEYVLFYVHIDHKIGNISLLEFNQGKNLIFLSGGIIECRNIKDTSLSCCHDWKVVNEIYNMNTMIELNLDSTLSCWNINIYTKKDLPKKEITKIQSIQNSQTVQNSQFYPSKMDIISSFFGMPPSHQRYPTTGFHYDFTSENVKEIIQFFDDNHIDKKILMIGGTKNMWCLMGFSGFDVPVPYRTDLSYTQIEEIVKKYSHEYVLFIVHTPPILGDTKLIAHNNGNYLMLLAEGKAYCEGVKCEHDWDIIENEYDEWPKTKWIHLKHEQSAGAWHLEIYTKKSNEKEESEKSRSSFSDDEEMYE